MQPRELPGRYGRVIRDLERLLAATETQAVVAGGWAVWSHGYVGRVTQDVDIADLVELIKVNPEQLDGLWLQLNRIDPSYSAELEKLIRQSREEIA